MKKPLFYQSILFVLFYLLSLSINAELYSFKKPYKSHAVLKFSAKVFLEGPFNENTNTMFNGLYANGLLDTFKFNRIDDFAIIGGEKINKMASGVSVPVNAVDVIRFVLRNSFFPHEGLDTANAWLLKDGSILDFETAKNKYVSFFNVPEGEYYIEVRHRNHLPISTAKPIGLTESKTEIINFSDPRVLRGSEGNFKFSRIQKIALMVAGDVTKSFKTREINALDLFDEFEYRKKIASSKLLYHVADVDFDGYINDTDVKIVRENNSRLYHFPEIIFFPEIDK